MARKYGVWTCDWCGANPSPDVAQQVGDHPPLGWRFYSVEWLCGTCSHEARQAEAYVLARIARRK